MRLIPAIAEAAEDMARIRRDIHAHPELGFEEHRTADLVAARLTEWGIPIHRDMAQTAVIGVVHGRDGGACGRAIGLRADMDGLPVLESNTFAHASRHEGKMHACGHDGHTAMLLAAAHYFSKHRNFDGTVYLIFQPAEEGRGGAKTMVDEGMFQRFPMEAIFGMHNWPGMPAGSIAASPGPVMAGGSTFAVRIRGQGAHAAMPDRGVDPVVIAGHVILAFQTIVSRSVKPVDTAVVSITMMQAGEAINVIPESCTLEGTVRTFSSAVTDLVEQRMRAICEGLGQAHGAKLDLEFIRRVGPVVNTPHEANFAAEVMRKIVGPQNVPVQEPSMASEDFAYMLEAKAGCYAFIGNGHGDHRLVGHGEGPCMLHNPAYDFNDGVLPLGATYWVRLSEEWLATPR
ncbi:MAG: amidohydrolase [Betaproteobacteria bacterium]|nr:amidohydrolase [Betaproteobacteria bacterium]